MNDGPGAATWLVLFLAVCIMCFCVAMIVRLVIEGLSDRRHNRSVNERIAELQNRRPE